MAETNGNIERELDIAIHRLKCVTAELVKNQEHLLALMNLKFDINLLRAEMVGFRTMMQQKTNFSGVDYMQFVIRQINGYISSTEQNLKIAILEDGQVINQPEIKKVG